MDIQYWITLFASVLTPLLADVAHQCAQVLQIDCLTSYKPEGNEAVCASDMIVYQNLCFFTQAKCTQSSLVVLYPGDCLATTPLPIFNTPAPPTNETATPSGPAHPGNSGLIYAVFCENAAKFECGNELDPVCGTDNVFYQNDCELAKAKCNNPTLKAQDLSICKTVNRVRQHFGIH